MLSFAEFFDHLRVESGNVRWFTAGDEPVIDDDLTVDPVGAGVAQVRLE
jgi:hypothetical protein